MKQIAEEQPRLADNPRNREVDLIVWAQECWTNRWKIVVAVCIAIIAVTALNLLKPAKYKSSALISLTKSAGSHFAEDRNPLFWPNEDLVGQTADQNKINLSADQVLVVSSYSINIASFGAVAIDATALNPKTARRMAKGIAVLFVNRADAVDASTISIIDLKKKQTLKLEFLARQTKLLERRKKNLASSRYRSLEKTISESTPNTLALVILNNQLDLMARNIADVENQLMEIEETRIRVKNNLASKSAAEGQIKILSVSAAKRVHRRLVTDVVFAGLASLLASTLVILVLKNRA